MNEQPNAARRRRARGVKLDPKAARQLMLGGGALLFVLISLLGWLLSDAELSDESDPAQMAAVSIAPSEDSVVWIASSSEPEEEPELEPSTAQEPEPSSSEPSSSEASSIEPASSVAPSSSAAPSSTPEPVRSQPPPPPVAESSSTAPEPSSSEQPSASSEVQEAEIIDLSQLEPPEREPEKPDEQDEEDEEDETPGSNGSYSNPKSHPDAADETLFYTSGGSKKKMNAFDLVCRAVQNETNGLLAPEALKAHAVATYSMILYNNERGIAPSVVLKTPVSTTTEAAVEAVLGQAVYYNGSYANTVYHSTSSGKTTSSEAVWGGSLPYLVSVDSPYDKKAPGFKSISSVSSKNFAKRVMQVYGIELDGDPNDWIIAERDAPGDYVGTVEIGGYTRSQGGSYGNGDINGRSVREQLLTFGIRSHCFEVEYNEDKDQFEFTTYGYGHGVGMSQYGAHFMALDGYDYLEILEHYYTGATVE